MITGSGARPEGLYVARPPGGSTHGPPAPPSADPAPPAASERRTPDAGPQKKKKKKHVNIKRTQAYGCVRWEICDFHDSNIVSAQIRYASGTCGFNTYRIWADTMLLSGTGEDAE
ncbi:hypothetical protein PO909_018941 [Leuciscus waleckii]